MRIKRVPHVRHAQMAKSNGQITPYSCGGSIAMTPHSVSETRIPVLAAPLGRGVENRPQRIEFGRAARILTGIGGRGSQFAGPEMAGAAAAARATRITPRLRVPHRKRGARGVPHRP